MSIEQNNEPIEQLDTMDLLMGDEPEINDDVKEEVKKEEPKKETKENKEDKEDKAPEIEIEGEDELDLEDESDDEEEPDEDVDLITPVRAKEILAKHPDLFKEFPYLKVAFFRDKQYTDIFPTVNDAKEAVDRSRLLSQFETELKSGSTEGILKAVKDNDPNAFAKIVDEYLPSLQKVDPNAFYHIVGNMARPIIHTMAQRGKATGNEDLTNAALILNRFLFESDTLTPMQRYTKENPERDKAQDEIQQQRMEFYRERFQSVQSELATKTSNALKTTIDMHIDPNGKMTDYVKRNAVRDCLSGVEQLISNDRPFRVHLDNLWKRAAEENFSRQSTDRIRAAFLSKAKVYLRPALQKARNEALKGASKQTDSTKNKRGPVPVGRATTSSKTSGETSIKQGEKTLDFFMRD